MRTVATLAAVASLIVLAAAPARAHIAEGKTNLTVPEEDHVVTGISGATAGKVSLELTHALTLTYEVTAHDLTGAATVAPIHEGAPGAAGPPIFTLTQVDDTTAERSASP